MYNPYKIAIHRSTIEIKILYGLLFILRGKSGIRKQNSESLLSKTLLSTNHVGNYDASKTSNRSEY